MRKFNPANFIIVFLFFIALVFLYVAAGNTLDSRVNDSFINLITKIKHKYSDNRVVLAVIDDKSIEAAEWPWSRDKFAKIFDYLENTAKAKVIIFNNLVVYPDSYNPDYDAEFYNFLKTSKNVINSYILLNSNVSGEDILPARFLQEFDKKSNVSIIDERDVKPDFSYNGIIKLPKDFLENVRYLGSSILPVDNDEHVRKYMPVVMYNGKFYPSVALSAYAMYTQKKSFVVKNKFLCSADNCKTLKIPLEFTKIKDNSGNKTFALTSYYNWSAPLNKSYTHKTYSAIDILNSQIAVEQGEKPVINPDEFKDKIVIIGLNAKNKKWQQVYATPVLEAHPDIDLQAVMIDNMLNNTFKSADDKVYTTLITLVFCFFIIRGFKFAKINLIFTTLLAFFYVIYYFYQYMSGIYVAPVSPLIAMYACAVFKALYSVITTDKTAEMIKHAMGKYVSKDVMKKVISNLDKLKLGGVRTVVTVFFVDIRNFTQISEELPPQEVTSILNEYFSTIEPVIAKYHGIVNKYIGDGLLAVFGEPVKTDEHAMNAVLCGIEINEKMKLLREKFIKENKPVINIGIGVNTGEVFAGNIGTEERFEYTVIGDNVNLASRIEAYNQILKTQFLISEYTYEYVKDRVDVVKLSAVSIKGKSKPIDIYEVLRLKNV